MSAFICRLHLPAGNTGSDFIVLRAARVVMYTAPAPCGTYLQRRTIIRGHLFMPMFFLSFPPLRSLCGRRSFCLRPAAAAAACLLLCCLLPHPVLAAGSSMPVMQVGFKLLSAWDAESGERIEVGVWYPSTSTERSAKVGERTLQVARDGVPEAGRFPTILLSHIMAGSALAHHDTARALAQKGFVVIAPTHRHDNQHDTRVLFTARHISDRLAELTTSLDFVRKEKDLGAVIDSRRIGAIGFDTGAAAVLIMAGGIPDPAGYQGYCAGLRAPSPYCSRWAARRLSRLQQELPPLLARQIQVPHIRAAALVAPGYAFLFGKEQLAAISIPVRIISAENDGINAGHAAALREHMRVPPLYSVLEDADSFSLRAPCPPRLEQLDDTMCVDDDDVDREAIHHRLNTDLTGFFLHTLGAPVGTPARN